MAAGAASEAGGEKRSTVMTEGKGQPCQWRMGEDTRLGGVKRVQGHRWLMQFLLSIPGSKENSA